MLSERKRGQRLELKDKRNKTVVTRDKRNRLTPDGREQGVVGGDPVSTPSPYSQAVDFGGGKEVGFDCGLVEMGVVKADGHGGVEGVAACVTSIERLGAEYLQQYGEAVLIE